MRLTDDAGTRTEYVVLVAFPDGHGIQCRPAERVTYEEPDQAANEWAYHAGTEKDPHVIYFVASRTVTTSDWMTMEPRVGCSGSNEPNQTAVPKEQA